MKKIIPTIIFSFVILCMTVFCFVALSTKNKEIEALKQTINKQKETITQLEKTNANNPVEEKTLQECMKNENYKTIGMTNCINEASGRWNKKIDNNIMSLKKVLPAETYHLLEKSQQKWIEYRDAQWAFLDNFYSQKDGTIYSNILSADKSEIVKHRAQELDELYFE